MASAVLSTWQKIQLFYQWALENGDKRTRGWSLVYSPMPVSWILFSYLLVMGLGPRLMAHRQPVNIRALLTVYHFTMVCLSAYTFYEHPPGWQVTAVDYSDSPLEMRMANVCWWFYLSKVIQLSETIFLILKKKNNQLTFVHVYHHGCMVFFWWARVKYVAGGQSFLIGLINSLVRLGMNLYYGLAGLSPHMHKYLWGKRCLAILQLLQFFIVTLHAAYSLYVRCDFPDFMDMLVLWYALSLTALFTNFCYQSCVSTKTKTI